MEKNDPRLIPVIPNQWAIVDESDYDLVSKFRWYGHGRYAVRQFSVNGKSRSETMQRLIMGEIDGLQIDHINGMRFDNRRSNLRFCLLRENVAYRAKTDRVTASKFKGVSWIKKNKRWCARIGHNNRRIQIGCYASQEEAALAYNEKAKELFGEFALLNIIE